MAAVIERRAPRSALEVRQFTAIYEASFPPAERDDARDLLASIDRNIHVCWLALEGNAVVGLAVVLPLTNPQVDFLEYLAVAPDARNEGLGARILTQVVQAPRGADRASVSGLVFEVERPDDATETAERHLRERRIGFYERNGACIVREAPHYRAPSATGPETIPFHLMWLPFDRAAASPSALLIRDWIEAIMTQGYSLRSDDPSVRELVATVVNDAS